MPLEGEIFLLIMRILQAAGLIFLGVVLFGLAKMLWDDHNPPKIGDKKKTNSIQRR